MQYPCSQHFAAPSQHVAARLQHAYSPSEWWVPKNSIFMSNISKDLNHCKFWTSKSQYSESYRTCKLDRRSRERAVNGLRLPFKGPLPVVDRYEKINRFIFSPSFSGFRKYFSMQFFLKWFYSSRYVHFWCFPNPRMRFRAVKNDPSKLFEIFRIQSWISRNFIILTQGFLYSDTS